MDFKKFAPGPHQNEPIYNPPVPYEGPIGELSAMRKIIIHGIVSPNSERFTFNLIMKERNVTALHLDVRFPEVWVRNASPDGSGWGPEERELPYFPFENDKFFELVILVEDDRYKVYVNNRHMFDFKHRFEPLSQVDTLQVSGDVRLGEIRFK